MEIANVPGPHNAHSRANNDLPDNVRIDTARVQAIGGGQY